MPLLRLQTTEAVPPERRQGLMSELSRATAETLGKPESYMMVVLQPELPMLMAASPGPAAFVEVRSVGDISRDQAAALCARLVPLVARALDVDGGRIYANFAGVPGAMWGHDGSTFG